MQEGSNCAPRLSKNSDNVAVVLMCWQVFFRRGNVCLTCRVLGSTFAGGHSDCGGVSQSLGRRQDYKGATARAWIACHKSPLHRYIYQAARRRILQHGDITLTAVRTHKDTGLQHPKCRRRVMNVEGGMAEACFTGSIETRAVQMPAHINLSVTAGTH
jgi:hypothetical protein